MTRPICLYEPQLPNLSILKKQLQRQARDTRHTKANQFGKFLRRVRKRIKEHGGNIQRVDAVAVSRAQETKLRRGCRR